MEIGAILGPAVTALATVIVAIIGFLATWRARQAEAQAKRAEETAERQSREKDRLRQENKDMDERKNHLINELQEDNDRLRAALRSKETRTRKTILPPPGGDG